VEHMAHFLSSSSDSVAVQQSHHGSPGGSGSLSCRLIEAGLWGL
jgi:hypothetical protein